MPGLSHPCPGPADMRSGPGMCWEGGGAGVRERSAVAGKDVTALSKWEWKTKQALSDPASPWGWGHKCKAPVFGDGKGEGNRDACVAA